MESNKKNKDNQQKTQFNFLTKKTPIVPPGSAEEKGESASNFLKKTDDKLWRILFLFFFSCYQLMFQQIQLSKALKSSVLMLI